MVDLAPPLPPRLVRRVLALSLAGSLALAACSAGTSPSGTAAGTSSASRELRARRVRRPPAEDGRGSRARSRQALDFVAEDVDGQEFRAADLAGDADRAVVLGAVVHGVRQVRRRGARGR